MAGEQVKPAQSLMDLNFQSLAAQELDHKQMELDSATAKLDQLRKELEHRRSAGQPQSLEIPTSQMLNATISPTLTRRSLPPQPTPSLGMAPSLLSHRPRPQESSLPAAMPPPLSMSATPPMPTLTLSPSPTLTRRSLPPENMDSYLPPPSRAQRGHPLSPRPQYHERSSSPRLSSGSYDFPRSASPVPEISSTGMGGYSDRAPPQRQPQAYEGPPGFAPYRNFSDEVNSLRRRPLQQRNWNESDLDMAFEKKAPQDRADRGSLGGVPLVKAWRESSLDPVPPKGKNDSSATLPRSYKYSGGIERGSQAPDSGWRSGTGTLPRSLPPQQPISRIPVPPPMGKVQAHRPLPLSMIFQLQNAFWEHQVPPSTQGMPNAYGIPPTMNMNVPPTTPVVSDLPSLSTNAVAPPAPEEVPRPLSPTRLQPNLPSSMADVQRVLEDMPRPLRRRGSQEHTAQAPLLPSHRRQYRQIMGRLFGRATSKASTVPEQPKDEERLQGSASNKAPAPEEQISEEGPLNATYKIHSIPEEPKAEEKLEVSAPKPAPTPDDPVCVILEASESRVGASAPGQPDLEFGVPVVISGTQVPELRSVLKGHSVPRRNRPQRARLDPLILLLDAALTGELDVVTQALKEVSDPSQPNEEGITALHNAICGANYHIVSLLIDSGANVNAADSHGWTPLHCAASCNDLQICSLLVRHGAAIFATTYSDGSLAVEKCDPYRDGYKECITYLTEVEECMGETQSGVIYALWDYSAEFADELSLREGDSVTVLRKDGEGGTWWWASLCGREGYVPRNYFGLYPRVHAPRTSP
ncbi:relA-associated inhibitor [Spea bombifrons]|uniref:relA-associated inhibitor n=1 Tax=Spea bombifrons TaxID=233779 RepID=UPI00234BF9AF|nr:relA-associated inhibitor [Spea bombifrons]